MTKKSCKRCNKELTPENTADGVNGYEVRYQIPEALNVSKAEECCHDCFKKFRAEGK